MKEKILRLSITQEDVDAYNERYFEEHKRAKKKIIDRPIHPSLNKWTIIKNRMAMNSLKQTWKDFAVFWCDRHGLSNMMIDNYAIECISCMPTKRRADPDNYTCKFLLDGFVEAGFLVDDSSEYMRALILRTKYGEGNSRTEINIKIYNDNKEESIL